MNQSLNYWYYCRPNEIFLDLDSRRALNRAMHVLRLGVMDGDCSLFKKLNIASIYAYPTPGRGHSHVIVVLTRNIPFLERMAWSAWLGNDRLRLAYILMRRNGPDLRVRRYADLLVTRTPYYRDWDSMCRCAQKHKPDSVTSKCPAMIALLGNARSADYFYRTGPMPTVKKRIAWGEVLPNQLKEWR